MEFKKLVVLLGSFFLIIAINFVLVSSYYFASRVEANQEKILSDIGHAYKPPTDEYSVSSAPLVMGAMEPEIGMADGRAANLKSFLRKYNSPLYEYADTIVAVSDKYHFDYRLLIAIAMQESQACLRIPENSYNCWGYGIYGDKVTRFSSYEEAIETVGAGIKRKYIDQGLITPEDVMRKYTPSSNGSWANAVTFFFKALE